MALRGRLLKRPFFRPAIRRDELTERSISMVCRNLSGCFRETYHGKIRKICIDGGFTCPKADGFVRGKRQEARKDT